MEIVYHLGNDSALWSDPVCAVYLLWGEEDVLKRDAEQALIKKFIDPDFVDFDLEVVTGDTAGADSILSAVAQAPFASERRVVVARGMEQWRDRGHASECDRLADGIASLSPPACLILVAAAEEDEARRKVAISPRIDSAVKSRGVLAQCRGLRDEALADWIGGRFAAYDKRASGEAVEALISIVGPEMRTLDLEIAKIVNFAGDRATITTPDVTAVASTHAEDVMFQCVDAICGKQTDRALSLLGELHRHDTRPQAVAGRLLALLLRQYRFLWQAKHLTERGFGPHEVRALPANVAAELPSEASIVSLGYRTNATFAMARKFTIAELRRNIEQLLLCDLANKGGVTEDASLFSTEPLPNLQVLVIQLTGASA